MLYSAGISYGPVSVSVSACHKSVFYRNGWTEQYGFCHADFFSTSPTLCFKEIQVSTKIRILRHSISNVLSTLLEKGGCSDRDKLDRRRSTKLIILSSSDARPP